MQRGEVRDPIMVTVLSLVTCGIYNMYWLYMTIEEMNKGLGEERFNFFKEIGLSVITCGLYAFYFYWQFCNATAELQQRWGVQPAQEGAILFVLFLVFPPAAVFLIQQGLNNAWEQGTPGGAGGYGAGGGV